ncbi:hypothetical protein KCP78_07705 [Salmonella enterica subsp. enterica]|nr:hypothetical protein KCP78_07705 [Salmonella enterica subsp. enterica]
MIKASQGRNMTQAIGRKNRFLLLKTSLYFCSLLIRGFPLWESDNGIGRRRVDAPS